jgi:hypothetical protein
MRNTPCSHQPHNTHSRSSRTKGHWRIASLAMGLGDFIFPLPLHPTLTWPPQQSIEPMILIGGGRHWGDSHPPINVYPGLTRHLTPVGGPLELAFQQTRDDAAGSEKAVAMLAGVISGLGWFKRQSSRENSPINPIAIPMAGEGRRVQARPEESFGLAHCAQPVQILSASERFRNCRASLLHRPNSRRGFYVGLRGRLCL